MFTFKWKIVVALIIVGIATWVLWAWLFYDEDEATLQKVQTYHCEHLPEKFAVDQWGHCCSALDLEYWRGGTFIAQREANDAFRSCLGDVYPESYVPIIAYYGLYVVNSPFIPTSWRWGYGWDFGHGFRDGAVLFQEN